MIGPSAPNGPPLPIEIADDNGLSSATFGDSRLPPIRMASIASGIPCPRILGTEASHQADHEPAQRRSCDHPGVALDPGKRKIVYTERVKPDQIGGQRDHVQQQPRRKRAANTDKRRHGDQDEDAPIGRKITETRQGIDRTDTGHDVDSGILRRGGMRPDPEGIGDALCQYIALRYKSTNEMQPRHAGQAWLAFIAKIG